MKKEHLNREDERSKISLDYFKIYPGQGATVEKMDDRDPRIHYGSLFKDWNESSLYQTTEKYATLQNVDPSQFSETKATISFTGTGIRIYGLKSSDYGKALVTLDGKEMPSLDFYSSAYYEKNVLIGEYTNLSNGDHILTLTVDPNSLDDRKMISLDSFDILKPPTVSLDTPSLAPIKAGDQAIRQSDDYPHTSVWGVGCYCPSFPWRKRSYFPQKKGRTARYSIRWKSSVSD